MIPRGMRTSLVKNITADLGESDERESYTSVVRNRALG